MGTLDKGLLRYAAVLNNYSDPGKFGAFLEGGGSVDVLRLVAERNRAHEDRLPPEAPGPAAPKVRPPPAFLEVPRLVLPWLGHLRKREEKWRRRRVRREMTGTRRTGARRPWGTSCPRTAASPPPPSTDSTRTPAHSSSTSHSPLPLHFAPAGGRG